VGVGLTEADLADLQGVIDTLQRPEIIQVPCPPIVADCPQCETRFNAKPETFHEVDLGLTPERLALAEVIERVLAKTGTATAHFAARDSN